MLTPMKVRRKLLVAGVALWSSGCQHSPRAVLQAERTEALTPTALIATAHARRGQTVTVVGYFTWRTDTRAFWENRDADLDAEHERKGSGFDYWAKCATIYPLRDLRRLSDRQVHITGKVTVIREDDMRSLWTCNAVSLEDAVITAE
ncbi:MAG TPA: hypothetical protein VGC56_06940 [Allosphingosinicella sp.]|jgi:hypothetical protein